MEFPGAVSRERNRPWAGTTFSPIPSSRGKTLLQQAKNILNNSPPLQNGHRNILRNRRHRNRHQIIHRLGPHRFPIQSLQSRRSNQFHHLCLPQRPPIPRSSKQIRRDYHSDAKEWSGISERRVDVLGCGAGWIV